MKNYAYYPGCAAEASTREADRATLEVLHHMGVPIRPAEDFACCGAGCLSEEYPRFNAALNARNMAIAEREGSDILTLCDTCLLNLRKSQIDLKEPDLRGEVNEELKKFGLEYKGEARVIHFLHLLSELGSERIRSMVKRPLSGVRIAPFYGCQIVRPHHVLGEDSPSEPSILEELIEALGGIPLPYRERLDCCGFHILLVDEKASLSMASHCLEGAKKIQADVMVTPCTLCHISLDMYQGKAGRLAGKSYDIPILHLAQMVGLALGINPRKLQLHRHFVPAKRLLSRIEGAR
jgi:succinate dehydrogenase / fumarate reductase cytochrome b subunit